MYLYGLVHKRAIEELKTLNLFGITSPIDFLESGELIAIIESGFPTQACMDSEKLLIDAIVTHDRILVSAFAIATVLPLRFGTEFTAEEALVQHLETNHSQYLETLHNLEGKVEINIKLFAHSTEVEAIPAHLKGRDYFLAKKQQAEQQQLIQTQLDNDREALIQELKSHNIQVLTKAIDHYVVLCDRTCDLATILTLWHFQMNEGDRESQWSWEIGESLPGYHFLKTEN